MYLKGSKTASFQKGKFWIICLDRLNPRFILINYSKRTDTVTTAFEKKSFLQVSRGWEALHATWGQWGYSQGESGVEGELEPNFFFFL